MVFIKSTAMPSANRKLHTYEEGFLLPVMTAESLIFGNRHKGMIRLIQDCAAVSDAEFQASYGAVLNRYMEFVQVIPHKSNGILGSLLNYGIARAAGVFQKYCDIKKDQATPLLKFAVFTASLLQDVARVMTNQRIVLTDDNGEYLEDWNPFSGAMIGQGAFFKMYPIAAAYLRLDKEITPMLARDLIPKEYFLWLSSDPVLFSDWLAALLGEEGVGARQITLALALLKREELVAILASLEGAMFEMQESIATQYGEAFYRWLKQGLENGEIPVNTDNAHVHVVNEGVLLEKALFKQFVDLFKLPVNFLVVYYQVGNLMGIAKKGGADYLHAAYFSANDASGRSSASYGAFSAQSGASSRVAREGMVVDAQNVFIRKQVDTQSSLKSAKSMTAVQSQSVQQKIQEVALRTKG